MKDQYDDADVRLMNDKYPSPSIPDKDHPDRITIGVIGGMSFKDEDEKQWAMYLVSMNIHAFVDYFEKKFGRCSFNISSGLTNAGIHGIAYMFKHVPLNNDTRLIGVACEKAKEFPCYPVDEVHIIGKEWGDESDYFLNSLDALVRVGGGEQSIKEYKAFKERFPDKPAHEVNL